MGDFDQGTTMTSRIALAGMLGIAACASVATPGAAQSAFDRSRNTGVLDRAHPAYDAFGVRASQFLIYPRLETEVEYNSNVYAAEDNAQDDAILNVRPSVSIESQWSRHSLRLKGGANIERHEDLKQEDSEAYRVETAGRIDIQRDANLIGMASYFHGTEPRGSSAYIIATESPIEYDTSSVSLAGVKDFNRVRTSASVGFAKYDYRDGVTFGGAVVDQDFRDRETATQSVRADYALSPATAFFGEIGTSQIDYDTAVGARNRDSDGFRALLGVNFEIANLATGEVSAGYITRAFDDGTTKDVEEFAYKASVNWYPTQQITVGGRAEKEISDSGLNGTPAYVSDEFSLRLDYEVLRNLIVSGNASYSLDSYQTLDRDDTRVGAGLSATYLVNRHVGVSLSYNQLTQDSSGADNTVDYTYRTVGLALVLQI